MGGSPQFAAGDTLRSSGPKSFAYTGVVTAAFVAVAAIFVAPAAIVVLGDRLEALDVRRLMRRLLGRPPPRDQPVEESFLYRSTKFVMGRSVPIALAIVILLLVLGAPFLHARWGYPDDRVLPTSASSRQVGDILRNDFAHDATTAIPIVIPAARGLTPEQLDQYAEGLSEVTDVVDVSAPGGTYVGGEKVGPPTGPAGISGGSALLSINTAAPLYSPASEAQLDALHAVKPPGARPVEFGGTAEINRDSVNSILERLPWVLGLIALVTLVLLFLLTGSLIIPLKALVLNVLSLTAAFGALVWIFQDGHLGAFGTTSTGTLVSTFPVVLFCLAFGLSMDYEVFLMSRIRERWLELKRDAPWMTATEANDESVARGLAHAGRVVTAAALIMAVSFAALIATNISSSRMFGVGISVAVLVDATLVRMVLIPAFMHLMGGWNWWAPAPLARLHRRIGLNESG